MILLSECCAHDKIVTNKTVKLDLFYKALGFKVTFSAAFYELLEQGEILYSFRLEKLYFSTDDLLVFRFGFGFG